MKDEPRSLVSGRPLLPEQLDWRLKAAMDEAQHHQPDADLERSAPPARPAAVVAMAGVLRLVGSIAIRLASGLDGRSEAAAGLPEQRWPY